MIEYINEYHVTYGYKHGLSFEQVFKNRDAAFAEAHDVADFGGKGFVTQKTGWTIDGTPIDLSVRTLWAFGF